DQAAIAWHAGLDARMVEAARGIRLLTLTSWPASEQAAFLADHAAGRARLPRHDYAPQDFTAQRRELAAVAAAADPDHPLGAYVAESARSWDTAAQLLEALGTAAVTTHSIALYGRPDEALPGGPSTREAARHFIAIADDLDQELVSPAENVEISSTALQLQLQADLDGFFDGRVIEVVLDPDLIAKAAAGATPIRLRPGAAYSGRRRQPPPP